jgi:L,D-transpeptidase YcbB
MRLQTVAHARLRSRSILLLAASLVVCSAVLSPLAACSPTRPVPSVEARADESGPGDSVTVLLRGYLAAPAAEALPHSGARLSRRQEVHRFYADRGYRAQWHDDLGTPSGAAAELLPQAAAARDEGLDPADYHASALQQLFAGGVSPAAGTEAAIVAEREILLTDGFLHLAAHLKRGRIDPRSVHRSWALPSDTVSVLPALERALHDDGPAAALDALRRSRAAYLPLREALARFRSIERAGGWPSISGTTTLAIGTTDPAVPLLRRRLHMEIGVPHDTTSASFDTELETAVRRYQRSRGLTPDGMVGAETRAMLAVPLTTRIAQLELGLERLRWLPPKLDGQYVMVSIPAFEMELVDEGRLVMRKRVIGGRPAQATPVFSARMESIVLSPYWNIPPGITARDIIPAVRRDPGYLARNQIRIIAGARQVDPQTIDWARVTVGSFPYRFRQDPGPHNSLGLVKFDFPNPHHVFLHDTPAKNLFERSERAFSSGCMRLEDPFELAEYLLRDQPRWTPAAIRAAAAARRERVVPLRRPVAVHVLYRTAWIDDGGELHFRQDLYGHDAVLRTALRGGRGIRPAAESGGGCGE